jgi:hypothetical protein
VGRYDEIRDDGCLIRPGWVRRVTFRDYDSYLYRYTTALYTMSRGVPEIDDTSNVVYHFMVEQGMWNSSAVLPCSDMLEGPDLKSHTGYEAGFLVLFGAVSTVLFGYIVAHMTSVISAIQGHTFKKQHQLHELQVFLRRNRVPRDTKTRLYKFYRDRFNHNTELNDHIFHELPQCGRSSRPSTPPIAAISWPQHLTLWVAPCYVLVCDRRCCCRSFCSDISCELETHMYKKFELMRWWRVLNMKDLTQSEARYFCARLLPLRKLKNEDLFCQARTLLLMQSCLAPPPPHPPTHMIPCAFPCYLDNHRLLACPS